jgi:DNA-binding SARP family transcriptional activator/predicted ATPase
VVRLSLRLLGPFTVKLDGHDVTGFRSDKVRALLSYLAVEAHRPWTRANLATLLWPDFSEKDAQSNLRNAISNLREVTGDRHREPPFLLVSNDRLQYNSESSTWLDVENFLDLVSSAGKSGGSIPAKDNLARLEQALALQRGEFMEGFNIASAPFEEWVLLKSEQIRQRVMEGLRLLVSGYEGLGELDQALQYARRWVEYEPWNESAHRHIMRILFRQGQRNAALAQFESCRQNITDEFGIEPELATTQLYEQMRVSMVIPDSKQMDSFTNDTMVQLPGFLERRQLPAIEAPFFVARQKELERLDGELEKALQGQGGVFFVTGDPGSGKTALLSEFTRRAMRENPQLVVAWGQCNAYTGEGDPYFPFLEISQTLCGDIEAPLTGGALTQEHATRLWRFVPRVISTVLEDGPELINRFLSGQDLLAIARAHQAVKPELRARLQDQLEQLSQPTARPHLQQATLFMQFTKVLCSLSQHKPLVLILDDLHWIDANSANLLFHLGRRLPGARILLLCAYRAEEVARGRAAECHPLEGVVHELHTLLGDIHIDLMQNEGMDFVESLLDSEPSQLSAGFRRMLHRHTCGHPLFTIELLRGMQLRGEIYRNKQGKWVEGAHLNWDKLPVRVEAVIAERIGHLANKHRDLLRTASVEGEHFTAEILAEIHGKGVQEVVNDLSQEIGRRHRLIVALSRKQIRGQTLSQYRFRHFLYQKYLYQQMDEVEKARMHEKMGSFLERIYLHVLDKYPEITHQLARHFELGGMLDKAVHYYTKSGKYAVLLSANREAVSHFERALHLVQALPESESRNRQALDLHLSLGPAITATCGWAAPALELNYRQAEELCTRMEDDEQLVPALWLLSVYRLGRSEHAAVDRLVERFYKLAQEIKDPGLLCLADLQVSPLYQGKLDLARQYLSRACLPREVSLQRSLAYQFGMSPTVVGLAYLGNCLWLMGFPEQAARRSQEACDFAEEINVPMTSCYALGRLCMQYAFAGEIKALRRNAETLLQITRQHGIRNYELGAIFYLHWAKAQIDIPAAQDIEKMEEAMQEYFNLGTVLNRTTFLILFAQGCIRIRQVERGLAALNEAIALGKRTGERWFEAEAYRLKGELLVQQGHTPLTTGYDCDEAEKCFQIARQVAKEQGARMLELRSATSLCRLWLGGGRSRNGKQILAAILRQFTEGLESEEMRKAKELLYEPA